jgi:hypothetical protein
LVFDDLSHLKEVYYFIDDARLQYKNCKHVLNLYCHEDVHVAAEWNFFATLQWDWWNSIGLVAHASLQVNEITF